MTCKYLILLGYLGVIFQESCCQVDISEYIINVEASCPDTVYSGPATITVVTDLPSSKPFAECDNGQFNFQIDNVGIWSLQVYTDVNQTSNCIFYQKTQQAQVYSVSVYVPLSDKVLTYNIPEKIVTCIYDPMGEEKSETQSLGDSKKPVKQIEELVGDPSSADISVCVAGVDDRCIQGNIRMGRLVKLRIDLLGNSPDEKGLQIISCTAKGNSFEQPLLIGGCGDDTLIPKNMGFTTTGKVALSPVFKAFRVPGSNILEYDCSVVVCSESCDGSSCARSPTRRKRALSNVALDKEDEKEIIDSLNRDHSEDGTKQSSDANKMNPDSDLNVKSQVSEMYSSTKGSIVVILLATITILFMAVMVRVLFGITRSIGQINDRLQTTASSTDKVTS